MKGLLIGIGIGIAISFITVFIIVKLAIYDPYENEWEKNALK